MYKAGGYEAHMTFDREHAAKVETAAALGWVYSVITGCPLLGSGTYCYLTGYSRDDPAQLLREMEATATALAQSGVPVLRLKIERIVYDSKTGVNAL